MVEGVFNVSRCPPGGGSTTGVGLGVALGVGEGVGDGVGLVVGDGVGLAVRRTVCVFVGLGVGDGVGERVGERVGEGVGLGVQLCRAPALCGVPPPSQTVAVMESLPTTELVKVTVAVPLAPVVPCCGKVVLLGPAMWSNSTQMLLIGPPPSSATCAVMVVLVPTCDVLLPVRVMPPMVKLEE
jgi:hypothetical protein